MNIDKMVIYFFDLPPKLPTGMNKNCLLYFNYSYFRVIKEFLNIKAIINTNKFKTILDRILL